MAGAVKSTKKQTNRDSKGQGSKNAGSKAATSQKRPLENPLEIEIPSVLDKVQDGAKSKTASAAWAFVLGVEDKNKLHQLIDQWAPAFQKSQLKKTNREVVQFVGDSGPVWILMPKKRLGPVSHGGRLEDSLYSWMRDQVGSLLSSLKSHQVESFQIEMHSTEEAQELGLFVALEMAAYSYRALMDGQALADFPKIQFRKFGGTFSKEILTKAKALGSGVNLARHLVNTPPNFLNPRSMSDFVIRRFSKAASMSVEIWDSRRLEKEGMGLHLGVGQGAENPPCLIHLKYRPKNPSKKKPIAFIGKGITFDSGGLDIKPASGMRLMKKDMGGAAAVLGLARWAVMSGYERPLDFYLAMAENSVDARSFRPSDVLTARNGMRIEIHNTDAEGRLVLADALDVAATQTGADEPELIVDIATLTGAIKVGLGSEISGLFTNEDGLAEDLNLAGQKSGELNWRMPLYGRYTPQLSTQFGDLANCTDGFGGAILAALFLEKFVRQKPWAHLDIYAWADKPHGPLSFSGGNGQPVQSLAHFLESKL